MLKSGQQIRHRFELNESVYQGFIQAFGDRNPLHTDQIFANKFGFEQVVMHGNILAGFLSYFVGECLPEKNVMIVKQEIIFARPVFLNDQLELVSTVVSLSQSVGIIEFSFEFLRTTDVPAKGKLMIKELR